MAPMEPRGALARYDPETDRFILSCASQSAFVLRQNLAQTLGVAPERVRVVSGDVGGGFGMRATGYPEYPALLVAAKQTGRPVRWLASRSEGFLSDNQARDTIIEAALALDEAGRFLALDIEVLANMGAYLTSHAAFIATANFARCLPCMYDIPQIGLRIRCLFSNTVPTGPYRGAGRRRQLLPGTPGRRGGAGQRHRAAAIAPAEPDPDGPHAIQDAGRHDLRQRRFSAALRGRARPCRRRAFQDAQSDLVLPPRTSTYCYTGAMQTPRSGHVAVLLPNNNQVLIAGGMSAGTAVAVRRALRRLERRVFGHRSDVRAARRCNRRGAATT